MMFGENGRTIAQHYTFLIFEMQGIDDHLKFIDSDVRTPAPFFDGNTGFFHIANNSVENEAIRRIEEQEYYNEIRQRLADELKLYERVFSEVKQINPAYYDYLKQQTENRFDFIRDYKPTDFTEKALNCLYTCFCEVERVNV